MTESQESAQPSERVHTAAEGATRDAADPAEGQGLASPGSHPGGFAAGGETGGPDAAARRRESGTDEADAYAEAEGDTEGERLLDSAPTPPRQQ